MKNPSVLRPENQPSVYIHDGNQRCSPLSSTMFTLLSHEIQRSIFAQNDVQTRPVNKRDAARDV